jgi:hypothetical protein
MPVTELKKERAGIRWVTKAALLGTVRQFVLPADVVVDVGTGIEPQALVWPKIHVCVEVHDEYVNYLRERLSGSPRYLMMHSRWEDAMRVMASKSVETVFALDFIEHLSKEDGEAFIAQAERIARRQVVLYTPLGYFPQTYEDAGEEDRWGMHGGYWQTHRSGWTPEDFSTEWEIIGCRDYHTEDQYGRLAEPIGCMWAIRTFRETAAAVYPEELESRLWRKTAIQQHIPSWCRPLLRRMKRAIQ